MTQVEQVEVPLDTRVRLAHAAVARAAGGLRVLHLKGPVAREHFPALPASRTSGDVDVLVHPADLAALDVVLTAAGWVLPGGAVRLRADPGEHAVVWWHPAWQVTLDVHHRFPGIGLDPRTAFDLLGSRASDVVLAGIGVPAPGRLDHAVLVLLHAARGAGSQRARDDVAAVRTALGPGGLAELGERGAALGAQDALAVVLPDILAPVSAHGHAHWRLRSSAPVAGGAGSVPLWLGRWSAAPSWRARSSLAVRALFPGRAALASRYGRTLSRRELVLAWAQRLGRGLDGLPPGLRHYLRVRRTAGPRVRDPATERAADPRGTTRSSLEPVGTRARAREPYEAWVADDDPVGWGEVRDGEVTYVAHLDRGPVLQLGALAHHVWELWRSGLGAESIAHWVAAAEGVPQPLLVAGVEDFLFLLEVSVPGSSSR